MKKSLITTVLCLIINFSAYGNNNHAGVALTGEDILTMLDCNIDLRTIESIDIFCTDKYNSLQDLEKNSNFFQIRKKLAETNNSIVKILTKEEFIKQFTSIICNEHKANGSFTFFVTGISKNESEDLGISLSTSDLGFAGVGINARFFDQ